MKLFIWIYWENAVLFFIYEFEYSYEKEWNLMKLSGGETG